MVPGVSVSLRGDQVTRPHLPGTPVVPLEDGSFSRTRAELGDGEPDIQSPLSLV